MTDSRNELESGPARKLGGQVEGLGPRGPSGVARSRRGATACSRIRAWPTIAWALLLLLSAALHLWDLGERSYHHDEAIHAHASYQLLHDGIYRYDPTYHGPLLYYLTAATFIVTGDSDLTARLPIALAGIALTGICWLLRRPLGGRAAWWTGLLVTISPMCLYYGRFLRMDILEMLCASLAALAVYRASRGCRASAGRTSDWIWSGVWAAAALATKENAYVTLALVAGVWALMAGVASLRQGWCARRRRAAELMAPGEAAATGSAHVEPSGPEGADETAVRGGPTRSGGRRAIVVWVVWVLQAVIETWKGLGAWCWRHRTGLVIAASVCWLVVTPLYTVGLEYPEDWFFPGKAISYWYGQHKVERVAGPPWYHLPRLGQYELLPIAAACIWCLRRGRRMTRFELALILFGLSSIAMYSYLGEKVAWLGVHQVWAFFPLAGAQLARSFGPRGRWWSRGLAGLGLAATTGISISACFITDEISPHIERVETLVYVQTSPEIKPIIEEVRALEGMAGINPVASISGDATWPLSWYLRRSSVWWSEPAAGSRPPIVICDAHEVSRIARLLGPGYAREEIPLRSWWLLNRKPTLRAVARYLLTRIPWSSVGSTNVAVLRRGDGETGPRKEEVGAPEGLAEHLGASRAWVMARPWLLEARGMAVADYGEAGSDLPGAGQLVIADAALSRVLRLQQDGGVKSTGFAVGLAQPEDVEWSLDGRLIVADTWNHRVVLAEPDASSVKVLQPPPGGWYGPRSLDQSADGRLVVSDTGNKRLVIYGADGELVEIRGKAGSGAGELDEPGGVIWLDNDRVLVCDTGNKRLQVLGDGGRWIETVPLPEAWTSYYARPQIVALGPRLWLASDTPGRALWLVDDGRVVRIPLRMAGIQPTGLAWKAPTLYIGDLSGSVWEVELSDQWLKEHLDLG